MTNYLVPEKSAHWYYPNGRPAYEIPLKTRPNELRAPTVKDAREMGLLPSVTGIMGMLYKPALANWIATQYILSALTLPMLPGESHDSFARRVVQDARVEGQQAADFGTVIHSLAEGYLKGELPEQVSSTELLFLQGFMDWCAQHTIQVDKLELSFANPTLRYGGRIDFTGWIDGVRTIADWKTQKTEARKPFNFHPDWGTQLAGYRAGLEEPDAFLLSVAISSTEPGRVESFVWLDDWCLESFEALRVLFYSPLGPGSKLIGKEDV